MPLSPPSTRSPPGTWSPRNMPAYASAPCAWGPLVKWLWAKIMLIGAFFHEPPLPKSNHPLSRSPGFPSPDHLSELPC